MNMSKQKSIFDRLICYIQPYDISALNAMQKIAFKEIKRFCPSQKNKLFLIIYERGVPLSSILSVDTMRGVAKTLLFHGLPVIITAPANLESLKIDAKLSSHRPKSKVKGNFLGFFTGGGGKKYVLKMRIIGGDLANEIDVLKKLDGQQGKFPKLYRNCEKNYWHICTFIQGVKRPSQLCAGKVFLADVAELYYLLTGISHCSVREYLNQRGSSLEDISPMFEGDKCLSHYIDKKNEFLDKTITMGLTYGGKSLFKDCYVTPSGSGCLFDFEDATFAPIAKDIVVLLHDHRLAALKLMEKLRIDSDLSTEEQIALYVAVQSSKL